MQDYSEKVSKKLTLQTYGERMGVPFFVYFVDKIEEGYDFK